MNFSDVYKKSGSTYRRLKEGSLPTLNLPQKSVTTKKLDPKKPPNPRKTEEQEGPECLCVKEVTFQMLQQSSLGQIPASWLCQSTNDYIYLLKTEDNRIKYHLTIDKDLNCEVRYDNFLFPVKIKATSIDLLIRTVENRKICTGITSKHLQTYSQLEPSTAKYFRHINLFMDTSQNISYESCVRATVCKGFVEDIQKEICLSY
ncbi:hypothetical protein SNE40_023418 [Patella caerulea]|uniref:Uncharacterized protein n=1 Tax=Patella caerulea TaxID=87958 RepID=A0AAN8G761_PATCE